LRFVWVLRGRRCSGAENLGTSQPENKSTKNYLPALPDRKSINIFIKLLLRSLKTREVSELKVQLEDLKTATIFSSFIQFG